MSKITISISTKDDNEILNVNGEDISSYTYPKKEEVINDIKSYIKSTNIDITADEIRNLVNKYFLTYKAPKYDNNQKNKKKSIKCSKYGCGGEAVKTNYIYKCAVCGTEYNEDGTQVQMPWHKEPEHNELIECTGQEAFNAVLKFWKNHIVYQKEIDYTIDALWDIHTYFIDVFKSTPYRASLGSGNGKGKTRVLEIHDKIAHRTAFQTRPSDAFVKKLMSDRGTLLLDQAEDAFYKRYEKTLMYNMFTSGYKRGISMGQLSAVDHVSYDCKDTFGAKAFCMQEDGKRDHPINRRTLKVYMQKGTPKNKDIDVVAGEKIRRMLYYLKMNLSVDVDKKTPLYNDIAELIDPLIITSRILKLDNSIENELYVYALELQDEIIDESSNTIPALVLSGITACMKNDTEEFGVVTPKIIADYINNNSDIEKNITSKKVGAILRQMGLKGDKVGSYKYDVIHNLHNLEIVDKAREQYRPESISAKLIELENEFEKNGHVIMDKSGSVYRRFAKLNKLKEMIEKCRKAEINEDNIQEPIEADIHEDVNQENEAFKEYLEKIHRESMEMFEEKVEEKIEEKVDDKVT